MTHFRAGLRDMEFNLFEVLGLDTLLDDGVYGDLDADTARGILAEVLRLARGPIAASFEHADRNPITFDPATQRISVPEPLRRTVAAINDAGWSAIGMPEAMGGVAAPAPLRWCVQELVISANPAAHFYNLGPLMHTVLFTEGTEEQRRWARHAWERRWAGTMVLTEPEAGSDVGMARTRAVRQDDGTWHLEGVKRFISGGDVGETAENILHLTLARPVGRAAGTKGLSLFVVPDRLFDTRTMVLGERNGVRVTGLEHKMGIKSSPTCELSFGADGPAVGYLVGEVHDGIAQMFKAIENARMGVGTMATGTLSSGYLHALDYARTRVQGADLTRTFDKQAPRVPIIRHPDVRRSLALQKSYAEGLRALYLYCAAYQDEALASAAFGVDGEFAARVNDLLLPVVKGVGSERAYEIITETLQVFGGSGYLLDHPIEQYVRDLKIDSLYEGTTAIQSQDFLFRKIVRDKGAAFEHVLGLVEACVHNVGGDLDADRALLGVAAADVRAMLADLGEYLAASVSDPEQIYKVGLASVRFLHAFGDLVIGWRLLVQAEVALVALAGDPTETDIAFYTGKVTVASWFARNRLPLLSGVRAVLAALDLDLMRMDDAAW
ncbi:acyl-CoA dehydrogenase [Nocardia takedensis]